MDPGQVLRTFPDDKSHIKLDCFGLWPRNDEKNSPKQNGFRGCSTHLTSYKLIATSGDMHTDVPTGKFHLAMFIEAS